MDVVLVDAKNAVYRHGWTRAQLKTTDGKYTGAIFGVLSCLIRLEKYYPKALFLFCWDGQNTKKSWRHQLCPSYKSNRGIGETPREVTRILGQIPEIKKMLCLLGFAQFEVENVEADDLIGIIATALAKRKEVDRVLIYSMDKDYFGLIDDKISVVRDLDKSSKCEALDTRGVFKKYKVHSKSWVKYRSLIGDSSDAIKSPIPKVGKMRALHLLANGFNPSRVKPRLEIEKLYKQYWPQVHMNYRISKIVRSSKHKMLPVHAREAFAAIIGRIKKNVKCVGRDEKCRNNYKKFISFCVDYEMNWIIENSDTIWRIGWVR